MADVVKQIDILNQIGRMLKAEFKSTVYSDEILEDFAKPCFFIKCLCTNIPQSFMHSVSIYNIRYKAAYYYELYLNPCY